MNKRGQIKLSFGMIFSIILIIFFIAFAIYGINYFLRMQKTLEIGTFVNEFQEDINDMWKSSKASQEVSYSLPKEIEMICFINSSDSFRGEYKEIGEDFDRIYYKTKNLVFYPTGFADLDAVQIEHLDMETILENNNPNCFSNSPKVEFTLKKDSSNPLVIVGEIPNKEKDICKRANTGDLCKALDFAYGNGYEKECCEKYNLCC